MFVFIGAATTVVNDAFYVDQPRLIVIPPQAQTHSITSTTLRWSPFLLLNTPPLHPLTWPFLCIVNYRRIICLVFHAVSLLVLAGIGRHVAEPKELAGDIYSFISDRRRAGPYHLLHILVVAHRRGKPHQGAPAHARRCDRGRPEAEAGQRQLD